MTRATIDLEAAVATAPTDGASVTRLSSRERALLWAPWGVLAVCAGCSLLLAADSLRRLLEVGSTLDRQHQTLQRADLHGRSEGDPSRADLPAHMTALTEAVAQSVMAAPGLLAHFEALAADAGVTMLQFVPEATATDTPSPMRLRLNVQGSLSGVDGFLTDMDRPALAIELLALRFAPGSAAGTVLCELTVQIHDQEGLAELGRLHATNSVVTGERPEALVPEALLGSAAGPHAAPSARAKPVANDPGHRTPKPDALAGVRLAGILRQGDRLAALLEVPGEGLRMFGLADPLGASGFRLAGAGVASVVLASATGERRTLWLAGSDEAGPWK